MKKLIIILALAMPMLVNAQKYGYVNTQELFAQMPEVNVVKAQMDTIQGQYETQLALMNEELQRKYKDYQTNSSTMADAIRQMREQELGEMQQRIETFYQTAQQDIQKKQQELLAPINEKLAKAIQEVGAAEGYTYIFDSAAMVYISDDAISAMDSVKKKLGIK